MARARAHLCKKLETFENRWFLPKGMSFLYMLFIQNEKLLAPILPRRKGMEIDWGAKSVLFGMCANFAWSSLWKWAVKGLKDREWIFWGYMVFLFVGFKWGERFNQKFHSFSAHEGRFGILLMFLRKVGLWHYKPAKTTLLQLDSYLLYCTYCLTLFTHSIRCWR